MLGSSIKIHICYRVSCNGSCVHALLTMAHREMGYESHAYGLTMADSRQTTQLNSTGETLANICGLSGPSPLGLCCALFLRQSIKLGTGRRSHCFSCHGPGPWFEGDESINTTKQRQPAEPQSCNDRMIDKSHILIRVKLGADRYLEIVYFL